MPAKSGGRAGDGVKSDNVVCFSVHAVQPLRRVVGGDELSVSCKGMSRKGCRCNRRGCARELDMDIIAARREADGRISCVLEAEARSSTWMAPWLSPTNRKLCPTNTILDGASEISQANRRVIEGIAALICR
jgi:hypothetical protein